jgi:hypothetical protein
VLEKRLAERETIGGGILASKSPEKRMSLVTTKVTGRFIVIDSLPGVKE